MPKHIEGPQGHPGGPNGPAAVLQDTPRGGATWKYAVSQNPAALDQISCRTPYLWGEQAPQPNPPSREGTTPLTLTPDTRHNPKGKHNIQHGKQDNEDKQDNHSTGTTSTD
jgi:hypothetical protein